ncbi:response regulator [Shewanella sp. VB17]|uniref:response regulator n=1 Tax=Shewanella sp. VB17 TaxID=2739432 RepID=UPI002814D351|nr:response regulator [Shewanella sp. VB17]
MINDKIESDITATTSMKADVLVVEDNLLYQELILEQLSILGYQCDLALDGIDGIKHWENADYKIIFTDCNMPNLNGYEMTKKIRYLEKLYNKRTTPIVAITGAAMTEDVDYGLSTGIDDFVNKPILLKDLKDIIDKWHVDD